MPDELFSNWMRDQLAYREWTQSDFARRSGLSHNVISQWATGKRKPTPESCQIIADNFYLPLDDVLRAAGIRPIEDGRPEYITRFKSLLDRIVWTPDRINGLGSLLESWIEFDKRQIQQRR